MMNLGPADPTWTGGRPILPAELLIQRIHGEAVVPRRLPVTADTLALAADLIALFRAAQGRTRGELEAELQVLEGDQTDYRLKRGLAHLLASDFSTFEVGSPLEPSALRRRLRPVRAMRPQSAAESGDAHGVADTLSRELARDIGPTGTRLAVCRSAGGARADQLRGAHAGRSLERYNLAQAQGVLYRASHVVITAHRNDPGEYKLLFRYLKLFG